ncbi:MAG TPA: peptide chain release factor N(5)-glutamine methyltransferase [Nocardioidaceae bacterium]
MTYDLRTLLADATRTLADGGVPSPRHDAEMLAAHVMRTQRPALAGISTVTQVQREQFHHLVRRRAGREPLQHLTGRVGFRYLDLEVGPGVFVPRPETEVMTGVAVDELRQLVVAGVAPRAVDLCTGCGAVAIALGTEVPQAQVVGIELSPEAAAYAERNARGTGVDIRVGDLADAARSLADLAGSVHVVTANPPYIPLEAWESVDVEVRDFDPALALWSGDDGLDAIRLVAHQAAELLVDGGLVTCEHADVQGESAPRVFVDSGLWCDVRDHPDLTGRPRFVTARRVPRAARPDGTSPGTIGA